MNRGALVATVASTGTAAVLGNAADGPRVGWPRFLAGFTALLATLLLTSAFDATGRWGLAILAAVLLVAVAVERIAYGTRPRAALRALGFGCPGARALLVAGVVAALTLLVYPIGAAVGGAAFTLRSGWGWLLVGLFAFHGLAEELVWRGFAYRRLRAGRSFTRAVLWTMPLVAVAHVPVLVTSGPVVGGAALLVAAVTSVPLARLYDMGRATIWAPALVHTAIDSFKLVVVPDAATATFPLLLSAAAVLVPLLVLTVGDRADGLWAAVRRPVSALLGAGTLLAVAVGLDGGTAGARDAALLIGAPALWILLPFSTVWLLVGLARFALRGPADPPRTNAAAAVSSPPRPVTRCTPLSPDTTSSDTTRSTP